MCGKRWRTGASILVILGRETLFQTLSSYRSDREETRVGEVNARADAEREQVADRRRRSTSVIDGLAYSRRRA